MWDEGCGIETEDRGQREAMAMEMKEEGGGGGGGRRGIVLLVILAAVYGLWMAFEISKSAIIRYWKSGRTTTSCMS
jgi:hypothetical protein